MSARRIAVAVLVVLVAIVAAALPALAGYEGGHPHPGTTSPGASADLSLTKADSPDPVNQGANLTYTISIHNAGPQAATAVSATDNLPPDETFQSATPSQGTCNLSVTTVTCALGAIAANGNATITIVLSATTPGEISNTASVSSAVFDPNSANNSDTEDTFVNRSSSTSVTVTGNGYKDLNHNGTGDLNGDIRVGSFDITATDGVAQGTGGFRDGRADPPGMPRSGFNCTFHFPATLEVLSPNSVHVSGTIKHCAKQVGPAKTFDIVLVDGGPNPPNTDHFVIKLFDQNDQLIYGVQGNTTVGLGDIVIETGPGPS
jgi:uncharacterized repeat protein (TIGR01451 family)